MCVYVCARVYLYARMLKRICKITVYCTCILYCIRRIFIYDVNNKQHYVVYLRSVYC